MCLRKQLRQESKNFQIDPEVSNLDDPDKHADQYFSKIREINQIGTKTKVLVIPTNEELEIARQSYELVR